VLAGGFGHGHVMGHQAPDVDTQVATAPRQQRDGNRHRHNREDDDGCRARLDDECLVHLIAV